MKTETKRKNLLDKMDVGVKGFSSACAGGISYILFNNREEAIDNAINKDLFSVSQEYAEPIYNALTAGFGLTALMFTGATLLTLNSLRKNKNSYKVK